MTTMESSGGGCGGNVSASNNSSAIPDIAFSEGKDSAFCNDIFGDSAALKSHSVSPLDDTLLADSDNCRMCGEILVVPRVLSCLHVFCEQCLDRKLMGDSGDAGSIDTAIECPTCSQETKVGSSKLAALPLDIISTNITDVSHSTDLQCTSCTTKEAAVSRCCTCHNLLCGNCDKAHRFMRLFETHRVNTLEEIRREGRKITIHKPVECEIHVTEHILYYCATCAKSICSECLKTDHKMHQTEGIQECELRIRQDLEQILQDAKVRTNEMNASQTEIGGAFEELASQRDTAKDLINESYQSFKAAIERCRDTALEELGQLYHDRELKIMELTHKMGKDIGALEDACKFTTKLLENGTGGEVIYLNKFSTDQLRKLLSNSIPTLDRSYTVEFHTDYKMFEQMARRFFGSFVTESTLSNTAQQSSVACHSNGVGQPVVGRKMIENELGIKNKYFKTIPAPLKITNPIGNQVISNGAHSLASSSPLSLGTASSIQSPFDGGNLNELSNNLANLPVLTASSGSMSNSGLQGYSTIAEYNLAQLASLAENSVSPRDANPNSPCNNLVATTGGEPNAHSPSESNAANFLNADLFQNDTVYKNLQSLAKIGLGDHNNHLANGSNTLNIGRTNSPSALSISSQLLNGGPGCVSNSTSPLLSTPDDIMNVDPLSASGAVTHTSISNAAHMVTRVNKVSPMQIRCKFGQLGASKSQFNSPHGFCLGIEEDIVVADTNNHRIQIFEKNGNFKFQFGVAGKEEGQLWYPRKVAVMRSCGKYVVCDRGNERSRMQIFTKNGHFLKKIAIRYIDIVAGLAVTSNGEIVAVDSVSPTVFVISETGDLIRWFDCSDYMREPSDIAIHGHEFYVCDFKGHNVVVFGDDGSYKRRIGWESITSFPNGIDISDAGDVLIGDSHGNRFHVAVFSRDGPLLSEFECPYVKVSRCCGLKITSEGYVVTLAKNNHHVLVLNTLYIL